jgi:hypothetical protein
MKHRFFDIIAENADGSEISVNREFVLELPEHNMDDAVDRQEFLGIMFDSVIAASGLNICSFSSQEILA